MKIFSIRNNDLELRNIFIDLHGLTKDEAIKIVRHILEDISKDLRRGSIPASIGDDRNHVVKIVCGRGNHSNGKPILKYSIPEFLIEEGYDIYNNESDGVVLVRLKTGY